MAEVKAPNAEIALQRWLEESLEPKAPEDDSPLMGEIISVHMLAR